MEINIIILQLYYTKNNAHAVGQIGELVMSIRTEKIKEVIAEISKASVGDLEKGDYVAYEQKIRAIEQLLHSVALIERM